MITCLSPGRYLNSQNAKVQDSLKVFQNIPYTGVDSEIRQTLDIYTPSLESQHPVIIWVHGGALQMGEKEWFESPCRYFANHGYTAVSVNYRLSPEVIHPAHSEDVAAAISWLHKHISKYGGNTDQIFIAGHSTGGYLIALLATDPAYLKKHNIELNDFEGIIPISAFFHVDRIAAGRPKTIWGENPEVWEQASPAIHVNKNTPPMLLIYADGDTEERKKESIDFLALLKERNPDSHQIFEIENRDHMSIFQSLGDPNDKTSMVILEFINKRLVED